MSFDSYVTDWGASARKKKKGVAGQVLRFDKNGIQVSVPDNSPSTVVARDVMAKLLGHVPNSMYQRPATVIPFKDESTYDKLAKAGVRVGTPITSLPALLEKAEVPIDNSILQAPRESSQQIYDPLSGYLMTDSNIAGNIVSMLLSLD